MRLEPLVRRVVQPAAALLHLEVDRARGHKILVLVQVLEQLLVGVRLERGSDVHVLTGDLEPDGESASAGGEEEGHPVRI